MERRVFGPVPSRRLGKSMGVNNIPHKVCSYSCMYCQVGKAVKMQVNRQEFYKPEELIDEVKAILCNIHIFKKHIEKVELLTGYEGNAFSSTGDFREDILSITAVHPMREDAVYELLQKNGDDEKILLKLLNENRMEKIIYNDEERFETVHQGNWISPSDLEAKVCFITGGKYNSKTGKCEHKK